MPIYFGGSDDAPAAYVEVNVFGRSVPGSAWEKLTKSIMAALNSELGIPEDRTYIRYTATTDWGWNAVTSELRCDGIRRYIVAHGVTVCDHRHAASPHTVT